MNALILMIAATAVSVEAGWAPLADGGVEYIIQIEPNALDTLLRQSDVESEIPPNLDVRRVRITVGTSKLPRQWPTGAANPNTGGGGAPGGVPSGAPGGSNTNGPASGGGAPGGAAPNPINPLPTGAAPPPTTLGSAAANGSSVSPPPLVNVPLGGFPGANLGNPSTPPSTPPFASDTGPALGAPAALFADSQRALVAQVLDDPHAPGKNPYLAAEQPHLAASGGVGRRDLLAESHATQRPSEERLEQGAGSGQNMSQNAATGGAGYNPPANGYGQQRPYNSNDRFANDGGGQAPSHVDATHHTQVANVPEPQERPWPALLFTVTLLLMSLSLNVYLGWVAWDSRLRYHELLTQHDPLAVGV